MSCKITTAPINVPTGINEEAAENTDFTYKNDIVLTYRWDNINQHYINNHNNNDIIKIQNVDINYNYNLIWNNDNCINMFS